MVAETRKFCGGCGQHKPVSEFSRNASKRDGLHDRCKDCNRVHVRDFEARNGKHILNRAYRYGLSKTEVCAFLDVPVCQCCGKPFSEGEAQCIDHCHEHGHVRGVICKGCNLACRGKALDAISRLASCVEYLQRDLE